MPNYYVLEGKFVLDNDHFDEHCYKPRWAMLYNEE